MEPSPHASEYFVWEPPGKAVTIKLRWEVMDRMAREMLRGFGAMPRRAAEVGGILLGRAVWGERLEVHIEDFEMVPCGYTRGPSYALSAEETARFQEAVRRHAPAGDGKLYAVGFFRSNTREQLKLEDEDVALLDLCFPEPTGVCLLVKPSAGRAGVGGFFFREDGEIRSRLSYLEFPFRRVEGAAPVEATQPTMEVESPSPGATEKRKRGNIWIPLSFIFLVLGVCLGLSVGHLMGIIQRSRAAAIPEDAYQLDLSVKRSGDALQVKWNRHAPSLARARKAVLSIQDGEYSNRLNIDPQDLAGGTLFYRNVTGTVHFKLEVFTTERASVSETAEYRAEGNAEPASPKK